MRRPAPLRLAFVGLLFAASTAPAQVTFCQSPGLAIPDAGTPVVSNLMVMDPTIIADLDVTLNVQHTWVGDLVVTLGHVDTGTMVTLIDQPGSPALVNGCPEDDIAATIDDEAVNPAENECSVVPPAIGGSVVGGDPPNASLLSAFDGEAFNGSWNLSVADVTAANTGTLIEWCLTATPAPSTPSAGPLWLMALAALLALSGVLARRRFGRA